MSQIEEAFKLFHDNDYPKALASFNALLEDAETPIWVKSRIVQYKTIAERKSEGEPAPLEPSLMMVSIHMNKGDFDKALEVLDQTETEEHHRQYLRAEIAVEQGDLAQGATLLKAAIKSNNRNLGYALNSPVFNSAMKKEGFEFLQATQEEE